MYLPTAARFIVPNSLCRYLSTMGTNEGFRANAKLLSLAFKALQTDLLVNSTKH